MRDISMLLVREPPRILAAPTVSVTGLITYNAYGGEVALEFGRKRGLERSVLCARHILLEAVPAAGPVVYQKVTIPRQSRGLSKM